MDVTKPYEFIGKGPRKLSLRFVEPPIGPSYLRVCDIDGAAREDLIGLNRRSTVPY